MTTWTNKKDENYQWIEAEDKNYLRMMDMFTRLRARTWTREEALQELVDAGILDENGHYTEPYKILEQYSASK